MQMPTLGLYVTWSPIMYPEGEEVLTVVLWLIYGISGSYHILKFTCTWLRAHKYYLFLEHIIMIESFKLDFYSSYYQVLK